MLSVAAPNYHWRASGCNPAGTHGDEPTCWRKTTHPNQSKSTSDQLAELTTLVQWRLTTVEHILQRQQYIDQRVEGHLTGRQINSRNWRQSTSQTTQHSGMRRDGRSLLRLWSNRPLCSIVPPTGWIGHTVATRSTVKLGVRLVTLRGQRVVYIREALTENQHCFRLKWNTWITGRRAAGGTNKYDSDYCERTEMPGPVGYRDHR